MTPGADTGELVDLAKRVEGRTLFSRTIKNALHDEEAGFDKHTCFMSSK